MTSRPLVAVSATSETVNGSLRVRLNEAYTSALSAAGLVPVIVSPHSDEATLDALLERVAGLVLTGGEDVDPRHFGAVPHPAAHPPHPARDACEFHLMRRGAERRLPTLAICRGIQVANVVLGGSLIQDIPAERPLALPHDAEQLRDVRVHEVALEPTSTLSHIVGQDRIATNSFHHQAVDRVGASLRVVGRTRDGITEAVESSLEDWWMVGVQWHPEELTATPEPWDRELFSAFAAAARIFWASEVERRDSALT